MVHSHIQRNGSISTSLSGCVVLGLSNHVYTWGLPYTPKRVGLMIPFTFSLSLAWLGLTCRHNFVLIHTIRHAGRPDDQPTGANRGHTGARPKCQTCSSHSSTISHSHWLGLGCLHRFVAIHTTSKSARRPTDNSKCGVCSIFRCSLLCPPPLPFRHVAGNVKRRKLSLSVRSASCNPTADQCGKHTRPGFFFCPAGNTKSR